jgi:hypothetical protein
MAINNLNNVHLTAAQQDAINDAITALELALEMLTVALTPAERKSYGSVNEQNKLLVNKVSDFRNNSPQLSDPEIDWTEFGLDYSSRLFLENAWNRIQALQERMRDAKILHDYDNYQMSLHDYGYTTYRAGSGAAGFENKMNELKQFFVSRGNKKPPTENPVVE